MFGVYSEQKSASGFAKKSSGTPAKSGSGKKAARKDDEWEEVSRKFVISLHFAVYFYYTPAWGAKYCVSVLCMSVSVSGSISQKLHVQIFCARYLWRGLVFLCDYNAVC